MFNVMEIIYTVEYTIAINNLFTTVFHGFLIASIVFISQIKVLNWSIISFSCLFLIKVRCKKQKEIKSYYNLFDKTYLYFYSKCADSIPQLTHCNQRYKYEQHQLFSCHLVWYLFHLSTEPNSKIGIGKYSF